MKKALTLIEALVVIAVISILAGTITPSLSRYLPGVQLNGTTRSLASDLRVAQERTVTEQKQYLIRFACSISQAKVPDLIFARAKADIIGGSVGSSNCTSYQMIRLDGGIEEIMRQINLPNGEVISLDATITQNQIMFSSDGGPSSNGNITLSNDTNSKVVNVSPAGFIKIQ